MMMMIFQTPYLTYALRFSLEFSVVLLLVE